jgi:nucleoside-diphosphate-sugar epimerase
MASCLVTGGGGFVGKALCYRLKDLGHDVTSVARADYPELRERGINTKQLDICSAQEALTKACKGTEVVFHVAAKVDMWGSFHDFFSTNVVGTRNVIKACKDSGVRKLVYTSSPSVIADGTDLNNVSEDYPYPANHLAFYPATKAVAEREVLSANNDVLWTLALRPHLIWGPGDTNLIPAIIARAKAKKLIQVGGGNNLVDVCFIDDCVTAHIKAMDGLENPKARGKAYFISQGEPVNMWGWINEILKRSSLPPVTRRIPKSIAMGVAWAAEMVSRIHPGKPEPLLTRFLVCEMATSHYFNISRAKELLGFKPEYTVSEALEKTFS